MKNLTNEITFKPSHEWKSGGTIWQQCDILSKGKTVAYERSCFPWNVFKEPSHYVNTLELFSKAEAESLASKYGAEAFEEPYSEGDFFLCFEGESRYCNLEAFINRK
jgi:hypothetical protein